MRRQNSSCDQCRKGKRACDAGAVKDLQLCFDNEMQWNIDWQDLTGPCSNCQKTRKSCTYDWARSQQHQIRERRQSSVSDKRPLPSRKRVKSVHDAVVPATSQGTVEGFQDVFPGLGYNEPSLFYESNHSLFPEPMFGPGSENFSLSPTNDTASNASLTDDLSLVFPASSATSMPSCLSDELPGLEGADGISVHDPSIIEFTPKALAGARATARKRPWQGRRYPDFSLGGLSEFSPTQQMMARTNNGLMTENLMKLYHDVLEGALSCWLTEQNCPYLLPAKSTENLNFQVGESVSHLPNRIYRRVLNLDKSLDSLGIKPLSSYEDRQATRALHFSIMAFTAQWAQGSWRSHSRYRPPNVEDAGLCLLGVGEDFDTTIQQSFWNQARRHLDDCSRINSFKVAFAEIVFGLTQQHVSESDDFTFEDFGIGSTTSSYDGNVPERIKMVFEKDGSNIYTERAARRLHVLRRRVDTFDRKASKEQLAGRISWKKADSEERKTMELIFWLAVMFDTLSAAMTERPVTVSDEESKDNDEMKDELEVGQQRRRATTTDWNDRFIIKRHQKLAPLRWPCPEQAVSRELRDAAPVKVLLFRKITRLQTLSSRGAKEDAVESAIQDALSVYRHWNMTYGPLFQDCVQYHDSLPSTVQSWYVCLLGHWLLAVMILADTISMMDEQGMSMSPSVRQRAETNMVDNLRRSSTRMVSDLARASTPRDDDLGKLPEYHHAAKEGALLTEPWTMVLMRSFTMAGLSLLHEATNRGLQDDVAVEDSQRRCEDCVKALWYLGRKSSLSLKVAAILGDGLERSKLRGLGSGTNFAGADY
ncbi:C6 zinc finger domain-containing protein [Colletotrichum kahawae]|uniref:C6 zinc finger domain-containing protein n=1 Tax=Colletotrichum kahawae TaxID=34407 RepID=A0AAD9Y610_COLKA|nr:C6 zinc finger domain-containing protein [Colletotrichum kahawae]